MLASRKGQMSNFFQCCLESGIFGFFEKNFSKFAPKNVIFRFSTIPRARFLADFLLNNLSTIFNEISHTRFRKRLYHY